MLINQFNLFRLRENFYFRDLHHIKVEMEEGFTPDGDAVRFDYQESKFPDYTWKGFVFINEKQVWLSVYIQCVFSTRLKTNLAGKVA